MTTRKSNTALYFLAVAVTVLLAGATMSAQITAFQGANELMMTEQSTFLNFIGSTFGPDPASKLHFSSVVDPNGESFSFSLDPGSTYMGQPIALMVSGELDELDQWHISSSGSYRGTPFTVNSKYISAISSGFGFPHTPAYNGALSNIYFAQHWDINPNCCFNFGNSTACEDIWSQGGLDYQYCYRVDPFSGGPIPESAYYQYSQGMISQGTSYPWGSYGANTGANYWGAVDTRGLSFTDGSPGSSTSVLTPLTVSTSTYFTDLGTGADVYNCCSGWQVSGNGADGGSFVSASQFTAATTGEVSRIEIGIGHLSGPNSFYAALYTDNGGVPGDRLADWTNLTSGLDFRLCCGVVSIPDVGIALTQGSSYFLVLGPMDINGSTTMGWNQNSQSVTGPELYSKDGGLTWNSNGEQELGAFDVLSQPQGNMVAANQFQLPAAATITQVDLAVGVVSGGDLLTLVIAADDGGKPGQVLYESPQFSSGRQFGTCCDLVQDETGAIDVPAGNYWLVLRSASPSDNLERWNRNSTGMTGLNAFSLDGGITWNSRGEQALGAFDIRSFDSVLYSNLGTGEKVYDCCSGFQVSSGTLGSKSMVAKNTK